MAAGVKNRIMEAMLSFNGLNFVPYITEEKIRSRVREVASELRSEYAGKRPLLLCVLNGAFVFAADLFREMGVHDAEISFVRYSSYEGTESTGSVKQLMGMPSDIRDRHVIIVEDIVDTGQTAVKMIEDIKKLSPASVKFVTLLHKKDSSKTGFVPDSAAFEIPPKFIIGYGLDLDGKARDLKDIYILDEFHD